jgi:hypothetical protein
MNIHRLIPLLSLSLATLAAPAAAQTAASQDAPALSALKAGAANPDCSMSGVTGDACPGSGAAVPAGPATSAKGGATQPAIAHRSGADVPTPEKKKKKGSLLKGVKDYFSDDMVKEGTAFGAGIGMLLFAGAGPLGIIGGGLLGAAVGAIICGGLFGKLFHHKS